MRSLGSCVAVLLFAVTAAATGPRAPVAGTVVSSRVGVRELVREISLEHGLDPKLMDALVRVESGYNPSAVSRKGAMGLMQLMPATADRLGVRDPFDAEQNVRGGMREFSRLVNRYRGNLQFALAAYNAGEGAVSKYRGVPPYTETKNYVSRILSLYTGKPYRLTSSYRATPVRMMTDPASGRTVITNQGSTRAPGGLGLMRSGSGSGPLKGGFGSSNN